ncbi:MAG: hypothetical protein HQM12_10310 [SAR324 cluster bacterium]|nr:hypothetical protein [SAR324 cluster bacterium]MBF0351518.1 hypothetical protein [SAR324 cluster bacterium]
MGTYDEEKYMRAQIQEIDHYLEMNGRDNPNTIIKRWIELYAEEYRRQWEKRYSS